MQKLMLLFDEGRTEKVARMASFCLPRIAWLGKGDLLLCVRGTVTYEMSKRLKICCWVSPFCPVVRNRAIEPPEMLQSYRGWCVRSTWVVPYLIGFFGTPPVPSICHSI